MIDADRRVLLMRWENPAGVWWITPGGGRLEQETDEENLRRELAEEIGLREFSVGPLVWERTHSIPWGTHLVQQYEVAPAVDLAEENVTGHRWWTLGELEAADERISPPQLADLVRAL